MGRNKQSKLKTLHDLRYKYRCLLKWNKFRPCYKNHILSIWVHYLNDWIITIVMFAHPQNGSIQNGKNRIHRGLLIKINVFKDSFFSAQQCNLSTIRFYNIFQPTETPINVQTFLQVTAMCKKAPPQSFPTNQSLWLFSIYKPIVR